RLEERLIAALPPVKRHLTLPRLHRTSPGNLPAAFWKLDCSVRLALALRWTRGYDARAIAEMLERSPDEMHRILETALNDLARLEPLNVDAACRACRWSYLDGLVPPRGHLLACAACRDLLQRWERVEHDLAQAIVRFTNTALLPPADVGVLRAYHARQDGAAQAVQHMPLWKKPTLWRALVVVGVITIVAGLIFAPTGAPSTARSNTGPRELLDLAIERYGAVPDGQGVLHQQFAVQLGEGGERMQGDVWTDASDPARHRMQLTDDDRVREWQIGDGVDAFRYSGSSNVWTCVPLGTGGAARVLDVINRWSLAPAEQRTLRERRWQFGPWAVGRRYLTMARTAPTLRSLGVVSENGIRVATLTAEGDAIDGSLMLKMDAQTGDLREVREVRTDNGSTRIFTPWRLLAHEWLTTAEAKGASIFLTYPASERPEEVERSLPLIDTSCPSWQKEYTFSLSTVLSLTSIPIVGLPNPPDEIDRIYLGGQRDAAQNLVPESLVMVYAGLGHRLTLRTDNRGRNGAQLLTTPSTTAIRTGNWNIWIRQRGLGWISGIAEYIDPDPGRARTNRTVGFYAEGWSEEDVVAILGSARQLVLDDSRSQRNLIYDPDTRVIAMDPVDDASSLYSGKAFDVSRTTRAALGALPAELR
ncbi:MAG: hypothetical protein AVDCRST_MAG93-9366, partial [uncultured Chloroflexia bacterium]